MTKYFFVLGNNPTLSIAELVSIFPDNKSEIINEKIFIIELDKNFNAQELIKRLGGTIKIGKLCMGERPFPITAHDDIKNEIIKLLDVKKIRGKFNFGISFYGKGKFNTKSLAMELKKYLKQSNISCRWVTSREATLSSVVVEQNKLISNGIEIVLINRDGKIIVARTLAVQPFKELSFRDYGRPSRDDYSGMLPPKLAQIMINLALPCIYRRVGAGLAPAQGDRQGRPYNVDQSDIVILDPFCGSGTILTEAMLMGYKNLIGADISDKAIEDTKANIIWLQKSYELRVMSYELYKTDVLQLSKYIPLQSADAVITEPYLGPQRGKFNLEKTTKELEKLYSQSLVEFAKILKPNGRVVMIWPVFRTTHNAQRITPNINGFKIISPIPEQLRKNEIIKLTDRNTIIYGREQQKVWREIVVIQKV